MSIDTGPWQFGHRKGGFPTPGFEKSSTGTVWNGPQSLHVYSKTFMRAALPAVAARKRYTVSTLREPIVECMRAAVLRVSG